MTIQLTPIDWSSFTVDWSLPVQAMIAKGNQNALMASKGMESVSKNYATDAAERLGVGQQGLDKQRIDVASRGQDLQAANNMAQNATQNRALDIQDKQNQAENVLSVTKLGADIDKAGQDHVKDMLGLQMQADASHRLLSAQGQANQNAATSNFIELLKAGGAEVGKLGLDQMQLTPELKQYATDMLGRAMEAQKIGMKYGPMATGLAALGGNPKADMARYQSGLDSIQEMDKLAKTAPQVISQLQSIRNAADTFDQNSMFGMGPAATASKAVAEIGDRLGKESSSKAEAASGVLDSAQGIAAIAYKNLVEGRVPGSLAQAMKDMTPSIHDSKGTFQAKTNVLEASQRELINRASMAKSYLGQNGSLDGFDDVYNKYYTENPLVDPKDPTKLNKDRMDWKNYLTPGGTDQMSGYKFNGADVTHDQIKYMASQTGLSPNEIIKKYGLTQ